MNYDKRALVALCSNHLYHKTKVRHLKCWILHFFTISIFCWQSHFSFDKIKKSEPNERVCRDYSQCLVFEVFLMLLWQYLKALKHSSQKFWPKILTPYFFYSNLYLIFLRSCCENIFKIVCIVSEKIEK